MSQHSKCSPAGLHVTMFQTDWGRHLLPTVYMHGKEVVSVKDGFKGVFLLGTSPRLPFWLANKWISANWANVPVCYIQPSTCKSLNGKECTLRAQRVNILSRNWEYQGSRITCKTVIGALIHIHWNRLYNNQSSNCLVWYNRLFLLFGTIWYSL